MRLLTLLAFFAPAVLAQSEVATEATEVSTVSEATVVQEDVNALCFEGPKIASDFTSLLEGDKAKWTEVQWSSYRGMMTMQRGDAVYCPYDFTVKDGAMVDFTAVPSDQLEEGFECTQPDDETLEGMKQLTVDNILQKAGEHAQTAETVCWTTSKQSYSLSHEETCAAGILSTAECEQPATDAHTVDVLGLDAYMSDSANGGETRLAITNLYRLPADARRLQALDSAAPRSMARAGAAGGVSVGGPYRGASAGGAVGISGGRGNGVKAGGAVGVSVGPVSVDAYAGASVGGGNGMHASAGAQVSVGPVTVGGGAHVGGRGGRYLQSLRGAAPRSMARAGAAAGVSVGGPYRGVSAGAAVGVSTGRNGCYPWCGGGVQAGAAAGVSVGGPYRGVSAGAAMGVSVGGRGRW